MKKANTTKEKEFQEIYSGSDRGDIKDELNRIINRAKSENEALQSVLEKMKEARKVHRG